MNRYLLFDKPECPFCWKVRMGLFLKGIEYEHRSVDTDNKPADLLALSPKGTVPVLVTETGVLDESREIMQFLDRHHPNPINLATNPKAREIEHFSDKTIGVRIREAIFMRRKLPEAQWDRELLDRCQRDWSDTLEELETVCSADGPWFLDEVPSVADCALLPRFALARFYGLTGETQQPRLSRWLDHLFNSGAVQATAPSYIYETLIQYRSTVTTP